MATVAQCPRCTGVLARDGALEGQLKCLSCGKHVPVAVNAENELSRYLLYTLSLPERTVRSTVALAAGTAKEAVGLLVPRSFQSCKTYEIVVRNSLRFLTEDVGGTKSDSPEAVQTGDDYLARKAVGNFMDLAGLATFHLSPMWMLAIVSDVAYGSKVYVQELAAELKEQGLIDEHSTIEHVDDILEAVQNASGEAASMIDAPPLSAAALKVSLNKTREAITSADYTSILPESEVNQYWQEMKEIAGRDDVSLLSVSTAATMHSLGKLQSVAEGTLAGVVVASGLFNEKVIGHYADSLKTMREQGFYETVRESYAPYVEAVWNNFSADQTTLTEGVLDGSLLKRAYRKVAGWIGGGGKDHSRPPAHDTKE